MLGTQEKPPAFRPGVVTLRLRRYFTRSLASNRPGLWRVRRDVRGLRLRRVGSLRLRRVGNLRLRRVANLRLRRVANLRLRLDHAGLLRRLDRRVHRHLVGAAILEQHRTLRRVFLGQAGAGTGNRGLRGIRGIRDRRRVPDRPMPANVVMAKVMAVMMAMVTVMMAVMMAVMTAAVHPAAVMAATVMAAAVMAAAVMAAAVAATVTAAAVAASGAGGDGIEHGKAERSGSHEGQ